MARKPDAANGANAAVENQPSADGAVSEASAKRQSKAGVSYVMPDGSERNSAHKDATLIRFTLGDGTKDAEGNVTGATVRDLKTSGYGPNVTACAIMQGIVTRVQRGYQNLTAKEFDKVIASIDETNDDLANDIWIETGTGSVSTLVTAVVMALESKGETVDAARLKTIVDSMSGDDDAAKKKREEVRAYPVIQANLASIDKERADKRFAEKQKKLAESSKEFSF